MNMPSSYASDKCLDRIIARNRYCATIYLILHKKINSILSCIQIKIFKINDKFLKYYLTITNLYDIVLRAVNAKREKIPIPQLEQINTTIKHNRTSLFDYVSKVRSITIAIVSKKACSVVRILLCKLSKGGDVYV